MKHLLLLLTLLTASLALQAQKNGSENSYNYARAEEAYDNGDAEQALHYLQKAIDENPKDADAYLLKAAIYYVESDYYGEALSNVNSARKLRAEIHPQERQRMASHRMGTPVPNPLAVRPDRRCSHRCLQSHQPRSRRD